MRITVSLNRTTIWRWAGWTRAPRAATIVSRTVRYLLPLRNIIKIQTTLTTAWLRHTGETFLPSRSGTTISTTTTSTPYPSALHQPTTLPLPRWHPIDSCQGQQARPRTNTTGNHRTTSSRCTPLRAQTTSSQAMLPVGLACRAPTIHQKSITLLGNSTAPGHPLSCSPEVESLLLGRIEKSKPTKFISRVIWIISKPFWHFSGLGR